MDSLTRAVPSSLAVKITLPFVALFAAVLAATMGLAAFLGGRIAEASIETEIRERKNGQHARFLSWTGIFRC